MTGRYQAAVDKNKIKVSERHNRNLALPTMLISDI